MVVSNIFHVHPYLGKVSILTNIFQRGWNHQPVLFPQFGWQPLEHGWKWDIMVYMEPSMERKQEKLHHETSVNSQGMPGVYWFRVNIGVRIWTLLDTMCINWGCFGWNPYPIWIYKRWAERASLIQSWKRSSNCCSACGFILVLVSMFDTCILYTDQLQLITILAPK